MRGMVEREQVCVARRVWREEQDILQPVELRQQEIPVVLVQKDARARATPKRCRDRLDEAAARLQVLPEIWVLVATNVQAAAGFAPIEEFPKPHRPALKRPITEPGRAILAQRPARGQVM